MASNSATELNVHCAVCAKYDAVPQRYPQKRETDQRASDAVAPSASGRLAGAGRVRLLLVRCTVAGPRSRSVSRHAVRAGQPVLLARRVARCRAAHRPRGPAAPRRSAVAPARPEVDGGARVRQEQTRTRHRERQVSPVQHLHVRAPDQALRVVQ